MVSVIIPCFNSEKSIENCLKSVYNQTHKQIQVICIDNNSKDNTLELIKELKRLKYQDLIILQEIKQGASVARNTGLKVSVGEWIQFLDADDELLPDKISHQINLLNSSSFLPPFVVGASFSINEQTIMTKQVGNSTTQWLSLFNGSLGNTCSNLWQKQSLINIGGWDENLMSSQESNLMFRLLINESKLIFDNEPLTKIFNTSNRERISTRDRQNNAVRFWELRLQILKWLINNKPEEISQNSSGYAKSLLNSYYTEEIFKIPRIKASLKPYRKWILNELKLKDWLFFYLKHFFASIIV